MTGQDNLELGCRIAIGVGTDDRVGAGIRISQLARRREGSTTNPAERLISCGADPSVDIKQVNDIDIELEISYAIAR